MTTATITVYRKDAEGESQEIKVEVAGDFSYVSSYNPNEHGMSLDSWDIVSPGNFILTGNECDEAAQALYDSYWGD